MNLPLTEEQQLIQRIAREFAEKELEPRAEEIDKAGEFPDEAMRMLADLDLTGVPYPQEYGGGGADKISYVLILEELARSCAATALTLGAHTMVAGPILEFGTQEQIEKYAPRLCKLEDYGAFALTEACSGTDAGALMCGAARDGDDYIINGAKMFITNGGYCGICVLFARTDPDTPGSKGVSAFIVDRKESPFEAGKHEDKMGIRGSDTTELIFRNCRVPKGNLIGKEGQGMRIALTTLNVGRITIAAQAVGIAQAALDEAVKHSKDRRQFGRPLAKNQAIQWMIADMARDIAAARLLVLHAAKLYDEGRPFGVEASMAKLFAAEMAMTHTVKAVQIHGGLGYIRGTKVERLMRDAKFTEILEGTSEVHRMIISGDLLK
ncbi:MAG: acyl-CoA dehydrogenase family protein [Gracilibacteraceae bacterium]|nr:acyl-CoA dehydrogenase family protein [Gracilibacteraceae bacterium]